MFKYSIKRSFEELEKSLELCDLKHDDKEYLKEVNYKVGTFIHWLIDYYDRVKVERKIKIKGDDDYFFSGIKYLNNTIKHEISFIKISYINGGITFPIKFPMVIPAICFKFVEITELKNKRYEKQHNNYHKYIADKEIISICERALDILELKINI